MIGAVALPSIVAGPFTVPWQPAGVILGVALVCAIAAEIIGRYLFFVSVVPQHRAAPYMAVGSEAA